MQMVNHKIHPSSAQTDHNYYINTVSFNKNVTLHNAKTKTTVLLIPKNIKDTVI